MENSNRYKFRAWDYEGKRMLSAETLAPRIFEAIYGWDKDENATSLEVMQFTGLLDKNGKEIYEGDIFIDEEDGTYNFVEWSNTHCGWTTNSWYTPVELAQNANEMEVVGNIYEYGELLK